MSKMADSLDFTKEEMAMAHEALSALVESAGCSWERDFNRHRRATLVILILQGRTIRLMEVKCADGTVKVEIDISET